MLLNEYLNKKRVNKQSDLFINQIIALMPSYVKNVSEYVKLDKNSVLLGKSNPATFAVIIISGEATVVNEFESGKVYEPVIIRHSDFLGVVEILLGMEEIISTNMTNTVFEYIKVPKKEFLHWINSSHSFTKIVLEKICLNFRDNMQVQGENVLLNPMYLLINYLLNSSHINSKHNVYTLNETREKTASRTGINLRTLYRHVKSLKNENYITITNRKISYNNDQRSKLIEYASLLRKK